MTGRTPPPATRAPGFSNDNDQRDKPGGEDEPVPVIARWADVRRAQKRIQRDRDSLAILQLRAGGFSEREIAQLTAQSRMAVRRRTRATLTEILDELGGQYTPPDVLSHVDMCLRCGRYPRVRLAAVRRKIRGGWKELAPERQASVCEFCVGERFALRIMDERRAA